jgi:hypothetical protein
MKPSLCFSNTNTQTKVREAEPLNKAKPQQNPCCNASNTRVFRAETFIKSY